LFKAHMQMNKNMEYAHTLKEHFMRASLKKILFACLIGAATAATGQARDVTLQWDPSTEASVAGYNLYYNSDSSSLPFNGTGSTLGASPVNVQNQATATVTGLDPGRSYYFAVTAYDVSGMESAYSNIVNVSETTAPTVSIGAPAANSTVSGTVLVNISATDNVGVDKVEYYINGLLKATDTSAPYVYSWDTTAFASGMYTLMAKAYDSAGNIGQSSSISVTVVNKDSISPAAAVTAPANNATVSGTVAITASASDNVGVSRLELYENGVLLYVTNIAPYSFNWNTASVANGSYVLTAKAYDTSGNIGQSPAVTIVVNNPVPDATAPSISLSAPVNGAVVSGTVNIAANATDNIGVTRVELYVNGALQAIDTTAPYSFSWNTAPLANGSYTLAARAYDAAGNNATSSTVTLSVYNQVAATASSIWTAAAVPVVKDDGPDSPVEVGVKIRSDVKGYITGIRFYKSVANTGTHVANLWSSNGTRLATATFKNETASGWQQVNFSTPVAVAANTVYVASYHTNTGHYSADQKFFAGKGVDNAPLHALADGVSGYCGVYSYGASSKFPNQGWRSSNYWVDVVFSP
jgi:chitinase